MNYPREFDDAVAEQRKKDKRIREDAQYIQEVRSMIANTLNEGIDELNLKEAMFMVINTMIQLKTDLYHPMRVNAPDLYWILDSILRCPSMAAPHGTTAYLISDEVMNRAREISARAIANR
jgi:hypothetical protein